MKNRETIEKAILLALALAAAAEKHQTRRVERLSAKIVLLAFARG